MEKKKPEEIINAVVQSNIELDPVIPSPAANHAQQRHIGDSITNAEEMRILLKEKRHNSLSSPRIYIKNCDQVIDSGKHRTSKKTLKASPA